MKTALGSFADPDHISAKHDVEPTGIHGFVQPLPAIRGQRQTGIVRAIGVPGRLSGEQANIAAQPDKLNGGVNTAFIAADDHVAARRYVTPVCHLGVMPAPLRTGERRQVGILEFACRPDQERRMQRPLAGAQLKASTGGFGYMFDLAVADNRQVMLPCKKRQIVGIPLPVSMLRPGIYGRRAQRIDRIQVSQTERVAVKRGCDETGLGWPATE
jgi:hypothetical protein